MIVHAPVLKSLGAVVQKILMIVPANQLFEFRRAEAIFLQVANVELESASLHEGARLAAGGAGSVFIEFRGLRPLPGAAGGFARGSFRRPLFLAIGMCIPP